jgi:hypothetical protein
MLEIGVVNSETVSAAPPIGPFFEAWRAHLTGSTFLRGVKTGGGGVGRRDVASALSSERGEERKEQTDVRTEQLGRRALPSAFRTGKETT